VLQTFQSGVEFVVGQEHDFYGLAHVGLPVLVLPMFSSSSSFTARKSSISHEGFWGFFIALRAPGLRPLASSAAGILDRGETQARKVSV